MGSDLSRKGEWPLPESAPPCGPNVNLSGNWAEGESKEPVIGTAALTLIQLTRGQPMGCNWLGIFRPQNGHNGPAVEPEKFVGSSTLYEPAAILSGGEFN